MIECMMLWKLTHFFRSKTEKLQILSAMGLEKCGVSFPVEVNPQSNPNNALNEKPPPNTMIIHHYYFTHIVLNFICMEQIFLKLVFPRCWNWCLQICHWKSFWHHAGISQRCLLHTNWNIMSSPSSLPVWFVASGILWSTGQVSFSTESSTGGTGLFLQLG